MTFETFDQSDEETWHDQQKEKDNDDDMYILHPERVTFETLIAFLTIEINNLNIQSRVTEILVISSLSMLR